jgi:hypothetical protein
LAERLLKRGGAVGRERDVALAGACGIVQENNMKPSLVVIASVLLTASAARAQVTSPACVEIPIASLPVSAHRKSVRSDCDPWLARSHAVIQSESNAGIDLRPNCLGDTTRTMAVAACALAGKRLVASAFDTGLALAGIPAPGGDAINATATVGFTSNGNSCVVMRDLPAEYSSTTELDWTCFLNGLRRTVFTAYARARCGVVCE